jgi:RHS repeat-associated protein
MLLCSNFLIDGLSLKGRMRHWLFTDGDGTLSIERAPSPSADGSTEGALEWYDYENKYLGKDFYTGNSSFPSFVAQVLPDGSTHYSYSLRGPHLNVTNEISTYTALDGSVALRTNVFIYAANAVDLVQWVGPNGEQVVSNYFAIGNTTHQPDASYDALNQATTYTYNGFGQLTSVKSPAGLTTTNIYVSGGDSANRLATNIDLEIFRTNSYTWSQGLVATHTDARQLTTTDYWDKLQRLVAIAFPDGSTISNVYTALDVTARKDRLNQWSYFGFNGIRQVVAATNENGVVTRSGYCDCGALMSQTNAWSTTVQQVINFSYDNQGNLLIASYPDGYSVTNWFDSLQRVTTTGDGTTYRYFYYNNQRLVTNVSNSVGPERKTTFDIEDRPLYVTDINGVTVTNTYDLLSRLRTRTYPDGGVEKFGYSARGLVAYTNQLNLTNFYVYDQASRKTFETNANGEVIRYTNSPAGDLLSLTDGKVQITRWNYDEYGRVTNKLDQAGTEILRYKYDGDSRLTNRWSIEKGDTFYAYDPVGNLTNIDYPVSHDVSFAYDALNRRTTMVDAVGTTVYTYTAGSQLLTEDGPWASDTVTNSYANRMRTQLALAQPTGFWTNGFAYDAGRRLSNVVMSAGTFVYSYRSGLASSLYTNLLLPNTSSITNSFDKNARLKVTRLQKNDGTLLDTYTYGYDAANERTGVGRADGSTVSYTYDKIGQLKIADSSVDTEDRGYKYDAAWNVNWVTNNGTPTAFNVNSLNELTNGPISTNYYDSNGNMTNRAYDISGAPDGTVFTYDDENRLIDILNQITGQETVLVYDGLGRLRIRIEQQSGGGGGASAVSLSGPALSTETHYIYDGWRVIQERNGSNVPQVTYARGSDLSGTLEGAGGIGGLLARSSGYSGGTGNWSTNHYYYADGNGNVTYVATSSQGLAANYRYDPFGNTISSSGSLANANIYRFSSKEILVNSGLYYYGFRFYDPTLQRWLNWDPLAERGFLNLYTFAANEPEGHFDADGLQCQQPPSPTLPPAPKPLPGPKTIPGLKPIPGPKPIPGAPFLGPLLRCLGWAATLLFIKDTPDPKVQPDPICHSPAPPPLPDYNCTLTREDDKACYYNCTSPAPDPSNWPGVIIKTGPNFKCPNPASPEQVKPVWHPGEPRPK